MTLHELCDQYLVAIQIEKGYTRETIRTFRTRIRAYCRFAGNDGTPADFNLHTLKRCLYHLVGRHQRPRTVKACFDALRSFGNWLIQEGALETNPVGSVTLPKLDAVRREFISDADVCDLVAACNSIHDPKRSALYHAVIAVYIFCGVRREEGLNLRVDDVSLSENCLIVRQGKGQKSRTIYPHPDCIAALREWLRERPRNCKHDYLFAYDIKRRVHYYALRTILEEVSAIAGLPKTIHPHDLRHAFARRALANGMEVSVLQNILGHNQLSTTAMYLRTDASRLKEVAVLGGLRVPKTTATSQPSQQQSASKGERSRRIARPRRP